MYGSLSSNPDLKTVFLTLMETGQSAVHQSEWGKKKKRTHMNHYPNNYTMVGERLMMLTTRNQTIVNPNIKEEDQWTPAVMK